MMSRTFLLSGLAGLSIVLSGCSGVRDTLGLNREAPDEFSVITRAPLEIPASVKALPPPNLGAPRPQEQPVLKQAQQAVFGEEKQTSDEISSGEAGLLKAAEADKANSNIRATLNKETQELKDRNKTVVQKILKTDANKKPSATVVDAQKEYERIKRNLEDGKVITDGETPIIEQ